MTVPLVIIIVNIIAFAIGIFMAKMQLKSDVAVLYSTRPLSASQIDKLNIELKGLRKAQVESSATQS